MIHPMVSVWLHSISVPYTSWQPTPHCSCRCELMNRAKYVYWKSATFLTVKLKPTQPLNHILYHFSLYVGWAGCVHYTSCKVAGMPPPYSLQGHLVRPPLIDDICEASAVLNPMYPQPCLETTSLSGSPPWHVFGVTQSHFKCSM